ncbi:hypothetical protein SAM23877_1353 [Streptomyces ambofaciens ATCC 23877]|uniref:Uncharacterized protein n=1 Tax=Streptomyces ambofaciens (strain ATCC 23877 / 3486 / DSM 40053 / JCM 4204 / NBRC 12836 / NRRL B-2516) TaxID=278992 RepID=A0A0K2ANH3_STRA7|nr:hypothetical protein SAM23877_1353 [Streptomyces ambofaciens ATCC 23877]
MRRLSLASMECDNDPSTGGKNSLHGVSRAHSFEQATRSAVAASGCAPGARTEPRTPPVARQRADMKGVLLPEGAVPPRA